MMTLERVLLEKEQGADIEYFQQKLQKAMTTRIPNPAGIQKLQKQIALLEDAAVIYHLVRLPHNPTV